MPARVGLTVSKLGRRVKKPYFCVIGGGSIHAIAQLKVSEEEFWRRLGEALGVTFVAEGEPPPC